MKQRTTPQQHQHILRRAQNNGQLPNKQKTPTIPYGTLNNARLSATANEELKIKTLRPNGLTIEINTQIRKRNLKETIENLILAYNLQNETSSQTILYYTYYRMRPAVKLFLCYTHVKNLYQTLPFTQTELASERVFDQGNPKTQSHPTSHTTEPSGEISHRVFGALSL